MSNDKVAINLYNIHEPAMFSKRLFQRPKRSFQSSNKLGEHRDPKTAIVQSNNL